MQIKFLTIYSSAIHGETEIDVQYELLEYWQRSLEKCQMLPIKHANIEFNDYSLYEYYNQEKLINEINYKTSYHLDGKQLWQALGKQYEVFADLYKDLAETHRLMELVIIVEDEDYTYDYRNSKKN